MGKGGRIDVDVDVDAEDTTTKTRTTRTNTKNVKVKEWQSPSYDLFNSISTTTTKTTTKTSTEKQEQLLQLELPTLQEIKNSIPKHCFERSLRWSFFYLVRDLLLATIFVYCTTLLLSTDIPTYSSSSSSSFLLWIIGWTFYGIGMGTIMSGPWVIAHECGHGAFSSTSNSNSNSTMMNMNDIVGFIIHQFLLVPYFAWQYTHAKHHRRTNHLLDGESHVPTTGTIIGLRTTPPPSTTSTTTTTKHYYRHTFYAKWHEDMGSTNFTIFRIVSRLMIGWPLYLLGYVSTGTLDSNGRPLAVVVPTTTTNQNQIENETAVENAYIQKMDHFRPWSPMFPQNNKNNIQFKVTISTITIICQLLYMFYLSCTLPNGFVIVYLYYWQPYFVINAWLVLYTWLHHTDPSIPHYGPDEWTWIRGALLGTVDRNYPTLINILHHHIGSTHVLHHLLPEIPHYHAVEATQAIQQLLQPKQLYNYDPTPWYKVLWKISKTCHYVDDTTGIQYMKSLDDIPLSSSSNNNNDNNIKDHSDIDNDSKTKKMK